MPDASAFSVLLLLLPFADTQRIHKAGAAQLWAQALKWHAIGTERNTTAPAAGASSSSSSSSRIHLDEDEDGLDAPAGAEGSGIVCQAKSEQQLEALCTAAYTPVCGKDGRTYHSRCHLLGSCVSMAPSGECGSRSPTSLPNFDYHPKLGFIYLCAAVLAFVCLILDHLAVPR